MQGMVPPLARLEGEGGEEIYDGIAVTHDSREGKGR
ncbi:unnamed protein product [Laminaria digitata]